MALVVDNSVVLGWFVDTQATPYTRRMRARAQREAIYAPSIWPIELVNGLIPSL